MFRYSDSRAPKPKVSQLGWRQSLVHVHYGPHNSFQHLLWAPSLKRHWAAFIGMNGASSPNLYPGFNIIVGGDTHLTTCKTSYPRPLFHMGKTIVLTHDKIPFKPEERQQHYTYYPLGHSKGTACIMNQQSVLVSDFQAFATALSMIHWMHKFKLALNALRPAVSLRSSRCVEGLRARTKLFDSYHMGIGESAGGEKHKENRRQTTLEEGKSERGGVF